MKPLSALIFPATEPVGHIKAKLLVFFDALSYYLASETDGSDSNENSLWANICKGYAPAPLGNDLSRFNRLLREMETSRPEEFSRLFAAAKVPQLKDQEETSASTVYSALHKDAELKAGIRRKERLWQARLVLKLAEILDRKETEVRQGLAQVYSVEQNLFAAIDGIHGEDSDGPAELTGITKAGHPAGIHTSSNFSEPGTSGLLIPLRVKAWAELYLNDTSGQLPLVIVADSRESGAILLDGYENIRQRVPEKLFSLSLPAVITEGSEKALTRFIASRNAFRQASQKDLKYFAEFLQASAGASVSSQDNRHLSMLPEILTSWEQKVLEYFPTTGSGLQKLDFYAFPGISSAELFQRLFHLEKLFAEKRQEHTTGLLAVPAFQQSGPFRSRQ